MSHHIARMAKPGLVPRDDHPEDGRAAVVVITPKGREAIEAAAPLHVEAVCSPVLDHVTAAEPATPARLSERVVERLDQEPF